MRFSCSATVGSVDFRAPEEGEGGKVKEAGRCERMEEGRDKAGKDKGDVEEGEEERAGGEDEAEEGGEEDGEEEEEEEVEDIFTRFFDW